MSRWRWQAASGTGPEGNYRRYELRDTLDEAYDEAERLYAAMPGRKRVGILLWTGEDGSGGVADSMEDDGRGWVVGRERWRENEAKAVRLGRA